MSDNKLVTYFKFVAPKTETSKVTDNQSLADSGSFGNYTWYNRLVQGSASRISKYREYDMMDNDVNVARALDTIAEEMTGNSNHTDMPLIVDFHGDDVVTNRDQLVITLKSALRYWCEIHDWENRLFNIARFLVKYGDVFFKRQESINLKWQFIHPKLVSGAIVNKDDVTNIMAWQVKANIKKTRTSYGVPVVGYQQEDTEIISADDTIRFTLSDDMADVAPFGESILRPVYRTFKQKELLEDALIIYRIQRAPERRAFYIDTGKMPPHRVKSHLEQIKNEIRQKKIPNSMGGQSEVDSVYNPQSMQEDYFFSVRDGGRGTRVEALAGGSQGLDNLADLEYFYKKILVGLRIPTSYMDQGQTGALFNDGKVGVAYIQELRFCLYISRLQGKLEAVLDKEFKLYLKKSNITVDPTQYKIRLPEPSNFGKWRQLELDSQLLNMYGTADNIPYMSKHFILSRYLNLTEEEIMENDRLLRIEKGLPPEGDDKDWPQLYAGSEPMGAGGGLSGGGLEGSTPELTPAELTGPETGTTGGKTPETGTPTPIPTK